MQGNRSRGVREHTDAWLCGAANDNGSAEARVQSAVLTLARLLGRQIAREQFQQLHAANDNRSIQETREPQTRQE